MDFNVNGYLPKSNCLHEYVGHAVIVKPVGYQCNVIGTVRTVLTNVATITVKECEPKDRFKNNELARVAVVRLCDIHSQLEGVAVSELGRDSTTKTV